MVATYFAKTGRGKSLNAIEAEQNERYPMTAAKRRLAGLIGCTQAEASLALENWGECGEWHHSGKFAARVPYYSVPQCLLRLSSMSITALGLFFRKPETVKARAGAEFNRTAVSVDTGHIVDMVDAYTGPWCDFSPAAKAAQSADKAQRVVEREYYDARQRDALFAGQQRRRDIEAAIAPHAARLDGTPPHGAAVKGLFSTKSLKYRYLRRFYGHLLDKNDTPVPRKLTKRGKTFWSVNN